MNRESPSEVSVSVLKALANPTRLELCWLLAQGETSLSDAATQLRLSRPLTAHHLSILHGARLVQTRRSGKRAYYRLVPGTLAIAEEELGALREAASDSASRPRRRGS